MDNPVRLHWLDPRDPNQLSIPPAHRGHSPEQWRMDLVAHRLGTTPLVRPWQSTAVMRMAPTGGWNWTLSTGTSNG
jgi:hypothetical protein